MKTTISSNRPEVHPVWVVFWSISAKDRRETHSRANRLTSEHNTEKPSPCIHLSWVWRRWRCRHRSLLQVDQTLAADSERCCLPRTREVDPVTAALWSPHRLPVQRCSPTLSPSIQSFCSFKSYLCVFAFYISCKTLWFAILSKNNFPLSCFSATNCLCHLPLWGFRH